MSEYIKPINKSLYYPSGLLNAEEFPAFMLFTFYERSSLHNSTPVQSISLVMPSELKRPSTVSYDNAKLGMMVGGAVKDVKSGLAGGVIGGLGNMIDYQSTYTTALQNLAKNIGAVGTSMLGSSVTADDVMGLVDNKISNPYYTMVFRGVELGQYEFEFTFTPNNEAETYIIQDILNSFRMHSLTYKPDYWSHFLGYPNEVEISFWWKGDENKFIRKFKRSVINYIDINDAPLGTQTLTNNGANVNQVMKIRLTELEIVTRDDVMKGY